MESNAARRPLRAALTTVGVLLAIVVVAVASRVSTSVGEERAGWRPVDTLVDLLFTLYLILLVGAAVFFVYLLALHRGLKRQAGVQAASPLSTLVLGVILLFGFLALRRPTDFGPRREFEDTLPPQAPPPTTATAERASRDDSPFAWLPASVLVALVVLGMLAFWWASARRRAAHAPRDRPLLAEELADVLEVSLEDLRAERDPRRAVIAAYARLERVLAAHGLPRRPSDAPAEYLRRVLDDLAVDPESVRRLTLLFERAKFSHHEVRAEMKEEAIAALQTLQDELRAAEALAGQERERAARLATERPRAAG